MQLVIANIFVVILLICTPTLNATITSSSNKPTSTATALQEGSVDAPDLVYSLKEPLVRLYMSTEQITNIHSQMTTLTTMISDSMSRAYDQIELQAQFMIPGDLALIRQQVHTRQQLLAHSENRVQLYKESAVDITQQADRMFGQIKKLVEREDMVRAQRLVSVFQSMVNRVASLLVQMTQGKNITLSLARLMIPGFSRQEWGNDDEQALIGAAYARVWRKYGI